ncbi:MAG: hypothetical protein SFU83_05970 [Meiothermus sp.]|nr:hypothetical protein [Meiothermus sp.]
MSEKERLEQIQTITRYFVYWQGLKIVPAGVFLLILAFIYDFDGSALWWAIYAGGFVLFAAGTLSVSRWYRRLFGVVSNPGVNQSLDRRTYLIFIPVIVGSVVMDLTFQLPVSLYALALAAGLLWSRQVTGGGRPHYVWIAGLMIAAAFLPGVMGDDSSAIQFALAVMGAGSIAIGILDHLELTRIFKPVSGDEVGS